MDPMPYAHLQDVRATKKPNANGERNGEMMKPIVQILSYCCGKLKSEHNHDKGEYLPSLEVEWVHVRYKIESLQG